MAVRPRFRGASTADADAAAERARFVGASVDAAARLRDEAGVARRVCSALDRAEASLA